MADAYLALGPFNSTAYLTVVADLTVGGNANVTGNGVFLGFVSVGTNPATAGGFRLPSNSFLQSRNAANGADRSLIGLSGTDVVTVGNTSNQLVCQGGAGLSSMTLGTQQFALTNSNAFVDSNTQTQRSDNGGTTFVVTTSASWDCRVPMKTGLLSYTFPSDANQSLNAAQSLNNVINIAAGVITATRNLTSATTAAAAAWVFIRNNTAQTVNFGWASGTTVAIATASSALVVSDGTNAVKLITGT